jgi:hypothetical protein
MHPCFPGQENRQHGRERVVEQIDVGGGFDELNRHENGCPLWRPDNRYIAGGTVLPVISLRRAAVRSLEIRTALH